ncbi:MAG: DUF1540 domain-containing protein [Clostridium septicum]|uniref:DUF1540 domain-containing protein n=1 Tax=Clostridium septicum TaxID=1504 RepID=UPI0025868D90|nr:DUF1540 domain-containing protein [Clostridium septicum]MDU1315096.1 DUF1540 domain-containing protein [Clostridium septicum]
MNRLSCNVRKCNHNLFGICDMHTIRVLSCSNEKYHGSKCFSFEKFKLSKRVKMIGKIDFYRDMLNDIDSSNSKIELPHIYCELINCKYNESSICKSKTVMIEGFKAKECEGIKCKTFLINSHI